jgi:hypothetical protein
MRQTHRMDGPLATGARLRRRGDADVPLVPTFQAASEAVAPSLNEDDEADEAVRRMIEAAYT